MTPLSEQRKALLGALGTAGMAVIAYYTTGGDFKTVETAITGAAVAVATFAVQWAIVYFTPNS